jgi:membrane protease subunit HflC
VKRVPVLVLIFIIFLALSSCLFVVQEGRTGLVLRLGKVKEQHGPGLHFKAPFFDDVKMFDSRVLSWDGDPERIPVKDSKFIYVDTFARWQISDAERFFNAVQNESGAQSRLDDILDGSVRDVVSTHFLLEMVRSTDRPLETDRLGFVSAVNADQATDSEAAAVSVVPDQSLDAAGKRDEVRDRIFEICQSKLAELDLGIELTDLRIKRIDYTEQVRTEVYNRMVSQQERIAERYRAQGEGKRAEISGGTQQELKQIDSESYRTAQEIKGRAEAESTRIYAEVYGQDEEFYRFSKSLETYKMILGTQDTLILSTDSDLLRYLKSQR